MDGIAEGIGPVAAPLGGEDGWALFGLAGDIRPALRRARETGETVAVATVAGAVRGAPRGLGAQMLIAPDELVGFLSGGCVEADVALHGQAAIADGAPRHLVYGQGGPIDIRLPCGGSIRVPIEALAPDDPAVAELLRLTELRRPVVWLSNGSVRAAVDAQHGGDVPSPLRHVLDLARGSGARAGLDEAGTAMFRRFDPPGQLVVFGSDPAALAIASLGTQAGLHVTLGRPRGPSAPPPVPGIAYRREEPADVLTSMVLDRWTAIVAASHDDIRDPEALLASFGKAGYVGLLGAKRRLPERLAALRAAGASDTDIAALKAPVGFNLGDSTPWAIAIGVIAEVVETLNRNAQDFADSLRPQAPAAHPAIARAS